MLPNDAEDECGGCCGCGGRAAYRDRMDCFKSGRDWAPGVDAALDGRFGAGAGSPKKSNPSSESAGFVCLGGAASAFCGTADGAEPVLAGGESSPPNKSG
jgi:hypothetical protein